jgi:transposase
MARIQSWQVSEAFWTKVEPLIPSSERDPEKTYRRKPGGGRKPLPARTVFEAIVYVLRTGIQWKALPKEIYGSSSSIHKYFLAWLEAGVFVKLWQAGLAEFDEMEGIDWSWQSLDSSTVKAPLAQEAVGGNPTDRGKKRKQAASPGGRPWNPSVARRDRSQPA